MEPDDLLCSRNARPQKALVGRAQWKINQPPSLKRERASLAGSSAPLLDGRIRTNIGATPKERGNERTWKDHFRPVEKTPGTFSLFSLVHLATPLAWSLIFSSTLAINSANCSGCGAVLGSKHPASLNMYK